ncbi:multiheme c-type cytochrome [Echinimonas agarilytica]|uniref:Cytochrome c-552/4 domain-containing protein n=1 Tax=Echinimonas agarilytica TaxID=1215918 RepID=A0AA41W5Q5_9GAMM|nr:multiheme c-type cytochrome [Echinimonas agarilytica]MCM2679175.1 hypothetical protein [Echinimonas agarilytica]
MTKPNKNQREIGLLHWFTALFFVLFVTGIVPWLIAGIPPLLSQTLSLLHLVSGIGITGIFATYSFSHFQRTVGFRRASVIFVGGLLFFGFCYLIATGFALAYLGVVARYAWVFDSHNWIALLFSVLLIFHIGHHYFSFPQRRRAAVPSRFVTLDVAIIKPILVALLVAAGASVSLLFLDASIVSEDSQYADLHQQYSDDYGEHPFSPSLTQTASGKFVAQRDIAGSARCIECHQTIGEQWLASAHRHAANDPTYVRNINLLEQNKGISATRYCEGCHAPIALLSGTLTEGGQHGGVSGTVANQEGISCMSCHGMAELTGSEGVASYMFKERSNYLFEHSQIWPLSALNEQAIRLKPQLHSQELRPSVMGTSEYCGTCHTQFMDKSMNNWGWVKMQDELLAWAESKFNKPKDSRFSHPNNKQCQDCHMPMVQGHGMATDADGNIKSHYFVGANVALAKHFGNEKLFELTTEFLQRDKIELTIDPPEDKFAKQSDLFVSSDIRSQQKYPVGMYRGSTTQITLLLSNQGVGHHFPGGTIDLNEAWIDLKVYDGNQKLILTSGDLLEDGSIEQNATVYKEVAIDRYGKEVWRHDLFNMVGRSYVNVIPSGTTDIVEYEVAVPDWATSPLTITATLRFRKFNQRYINWVRQDQHLLSNPIVDIARDSISVPLLKTPSTHQSH